MPPKAKKVTNHVADYESYFKNEEEDPTASSQEVYISSSRSLLVKAFFDFQKRKTLELNADYWRFITRTRRSPMALKDTSGVWDVYLKWHEYQLEQHDKDDFTGVETQDSQFHLNTRHQFKFSTITASEIDLFKNYHELEKTEVQLDSRHLIKKVNPWPLRLSNKINNKIKTMELDRQVQILEAIFALQLGMIADAQILETGPIMYLAGFSKMIKGNQNLVFAVVPERIPIVQTVLDKTHIVGFHFRQYLRIIDIVPGDKKQAYQAFQTFALYLQDDPDKWCPFLPGNFLESQGQMKGSGNYELLDIKNIIKVTVDEQQLLYLPNLDMKYKMSTVEIKSFQLVGMRWVSEMEESKFSFKVAPRYKNLNKMIIEKCTSEESCAWLLDFLEKIPNFTLRLTPQEKRLITTPGNVLCIGRSGTGKTTSAVLRLFALEILFKIRSSLFFKGGESLKASNFTADDAQSTTGLHSVIVTASPVLTNEIRRFYNGLKTKVVGELRLRELRKKQKENPLLIEEELKQETTPITEPENDESDLNEDEVLDMEEMERNMKVAQSISDMRNEDFPAFLTIKRLVYMIDASLNRPFFARNIKNEIIGLDSQAEWHNEQKGVLMINNYYKMGGQEKGKGEDEIDKFMNLSSSEDESDVDDEETNNEEESHLFQEVDEQILKSTKKRTKYQQGEKIIQEYAQEVDYELFERKFWSKHCFRESSRHITPSIVWTEIFSVIKGSHNSSSFANKALPKDQYVTAAQHRRTLLDDKEREIIYQCFIKYESWKKQIKGFDFMDLVTHILRELTGVYYKGVPIHFMLVDEVQDLTPATIKLLLQVTEQNVYFAGDTAQTIAKGVGFRFCDLKMMLNMSEFEAPKVLQLTVNFRSHNQILTLANSIISAIELFFPLTIDKLIKERSDIDGLKPIVLDFALLDSLFYVLLGKSTLETLDPNKQSGNAEFGCDQVIIVRDQESKKKVPSVLQHALCLTVYECKGLEFEDVILYNFFNDAPDNVNEQWKLINALQVEKIQKPKQTVNGVNMQDLDDLNFEKESEEVTTNEAPSETSGEYEYADRIYLNHLSFHKTNFYKEYSALCTDLKQLYVCITRPKKRLIIYDEDPSRREFALKYWLKLGAVDVINEDIINKSQQMDESSDQSSLSEEQRQFLSKMSDQQTSSSTEDPQIQEQRRKGWRAQGIKMFKRRYYEQAMKCFDHSGDSKLRKRAQAYNLAEDASKAQSEGETLQYRMDDTYKQMDKQSRRKMREQIQQMQDRAIELFKEASQVFLEIDLKKQAAQCLFTAKIYKEAATIFETISFYSQAGESYFILGDYSRAAMLFSEGKMVLKAVDCYKHLKNWDAILNCVKEHESDFTQEQREQLIKRYVPLALNGLYTLITRDDEDVVSDEEDQESMFKKEKVVKDYDVRTNNNTVIKEEDSDDSEGVEEPIHESESSDILTNQSQIILPQDEETKTIHDVSHDFEIINTSSTFSKKVIKKKAHLSESSFSIISSNTPENAPPTDTFEHLSQFDPEDEFLKTRSVSVLESVISGEYKSRAEKSELSDYSIIESVNHESNEVMKDIIQQNLNLIRTRRDIYAEDILMTKIIHYVGQFSNDVKSYLNRLRSKDTLLSVQQKVKPVNNELFEQSNTKFDEYDLDQIDDEFLNILLDCLESFELYKLCLIVCNRYNMTDRVGRYLVSIANKYSNLPHICTQLVNMFNPQNQEVQSQVSFIAHQALHSALELIDPKYLRQDNAMGQYCFTGLLNHGYWKKLLYLMDMKSGLVVASMHADFRNFRQIYLAFSERGRQVNQIMEKSEIIETISSNDFSFLGLKEDESELPANDNDFLAFTTALDSIVWSSTSSIQDPKSYEKLNSVKFPKCFKLSELALKLTNIFNPDKCSDYLHSSTLIKELDQRVIKISLSLRISSEDCNQYQESCYLYDTSVALFLLIASAFKGNLKSQIHVLSNLNPEMFQMYLRAMNKFILIAFGKSTKTIDVKQDKAIKIQKTLLAGMFSVLRIRMQSQCNSLYDNYGDKVLLHADSSLAQTMSKDIEDLKRKLVDTVSQEVFADVNLKWHSSGEKQKEIRRRLRERYQSESLNNLIEIADLEAQFMRAPITHVLDKVSKQVAQYIKFCTEKTLRQQQDIVCIKGKESVDNFEYPFEVTERMVKVLLLLNSSIEIQRFVQHKNPSVKSIAKYLGKHKIYNQNTLQYHLSLEKAKKEESIIQSKEFLVQIGLMTKREFEKFKIKKQKTLEKQDTMNINQALYTKNITFFSVLTFDCIPKEHMDNQMCQNILDIAYQNWEFFMKTKTSPTDEDFGEFKFALNSLALYIASDNYIYFMQLFQNQLPSKSLERKLLFTLLDAHIYKKCGHLLNSSISLLSFIKLALQVELPLDSFYIVNLLEMALVQLLSVNEDAYLPYEFIRQLTSEMWESEYKEEFKSQVEEHFSEDSLQDQIINLKVKRQYKLSEEQKAKYKQSIGDVMTLLHKLITQGTSDKMLPHLFISVVTLLINEPEIMMTHISLVDKCFDTLIQEELIYSDNLVFAHKTYKAFSDDFKTNLDYENQNGIIYMDKRSSQQSIWVKVSYIETENINGLVDQKLKDVELREVDIIKQHQVVATLLMPLVQRKKESMRKTLFKNKSKGELTLQDRLLLDTFSHHSNFDRETALNNLPKIMKLSNLSKFIRNVTLNSRFDNVIDLHYLLSQIHTLETEFLPAFISNESFELIVSQDIHHDESDLDNLECQIKIWSQNKSMDAGNNGSLQKNQKIMKLKWKEQAMKVREKLMAKVAAKKKEDAYVKKKNRIKQK